MQKGTGARPELPAATLADLAGWATTGEGRTMTFPREIWQEEISAKLRHIDQWLAQRHQIDLLYLAYATVAGLSPWPLVEAFVRSGRPDAVLLALYGVAGGVGDNLVA
jgi:hypothetical protein